MVLCVVFVVNTVTIPLYTSGFNGIESEYYEVKKETINSLFIACFFLILLVPILLINRGKIMFPKLTIENWWIPCVKNWDRF
jgi:hypothetical protein